MKSIIIIIAIFLVTLTAKADWVKSGELDSLYLGDAPITFSKYSPDYTKFVTYSAQDSTLRLWDLGTGKVIKERTFDKSYKYDLYEFDFKYEQLYFTNIKNEVTYANSIESQQLTYPVSTISFTDSITIIITASSNRYVGKYSGGTQYNLQSIKLVNSCLHIFYERKYWESDPKNYSETISYIAIIVENNGVSYKVINKILNLPFKFYFYNNSFIYYLDNYKGFYISRNDSIIYLSFDNKVTTKNYPYIYTKMEFIDYEYETISFSDSNNNIKLYSFNEDQIIDYEIPIVSSKIRNFKLISSPKYSIFYQDSSRLNLCDNQLNKLIDTIYLPEGKIGFSNSTNYTYSFIANRIFRNKFNNMLEEYDDIFTDLLYYRTTDSVTLLKNINQKDSNLIWKVNGNLYYGNKPKLQIVNTGFYKVELAFERNGKKYTIQKDSLIKVVDSLVYSDLILPSAIEVVKPKGWNYTYPFTFKSSWKNAKIDTYKWYINDTLVSTNKEFEYKFKFCNSYRVRLELSSIYFDRIFSQEVVALQDFQYGFSNTIGEKPLKMAINYKHFATYDTLFNGYKAQYGSSILIFYQYINGKLERVADNYHTKNTEGSDTIVFNTVGTYLVRQENYLFFNDWITYKPNEMDTAVIVLAPSDIQDFAEKKYIFKQDADGIYCQLEGEGEVALYDNVGRLVRTYQIENERYIRKEDLERGVYFLSIQIDGNVYHEKVLVE